MSGFILTHSYLYKEKKTSFRHFISHRLARLYPLHIFSLLVFIAVYYWTKGHIPSYGNETTFAFLQQLTLTQNIGFPPNILTYNSPSWSISVEFWVNIIFVIFISKKTKSFTLFILASAGLLLIFLKNGNLDVHAKNYFCCINAGLLRGLSSFLLGIIAYKLYLYIRNNTQIRKNSSILELIVIISVLLVVYYRVGQYSSLDILAPYIFLFTVAVFALDIGLFSRLLKQIRYLGTISYSIYLNQFAVIYLALYYLREYQLPEIMGIPLFVIIYISLLLIYSHFTYRYIERPLRIKGREFLSNLIDVKSSK